jgi:hypothetical protein
MDLCANLRWMHVPWNAYVTQNLPTPGIARMIWLPFVRYPDWIILFYLRFWVVLQNHADECENIYRNILKLFAPTPFLCLHIDYIIPKLSTACYVMRSLKLCICHITLWGWFIILIFILSWILVYYFGGHSSCSITVFRIKKIRIILGCKTASCLGVSLRN